jgi:5-oxoprolinase (ATP-hydrolysing)
VIEARERIDAAGAVLQPLDEAHLRAALVQARDAGLRSVAIAFLHGYRHVGHEQRATRLAREAGFEEVVASHEAVPVLGWVARGDTTVVDAYLSPVLLRYLREFRRCVAERFGDVEVSFMQSNGGLVDAAGFRGMHAVLSGPAGGVVGMAAAGRSEGRKRVIGFDMGGTSTDVSLCEGELRRRFAAGGGSIVRFADGRLQVGPESAGADPGPACYRRGGPPTVTDCNAVLGRIQAKHFPKVFGPRGDAPLDVEASRRSLARLAAAMEESTGQAMSPESLAQACVDVAVARMANAIREAALRSGQDPAEFSLLCFGGAAGQHACEVADALGIGDVLLHPLAGMLSAYGMGLAGRRCLRRRTVELELAPANLAAIAQELSSLEADATTELQRQGVSELLPRRVAHVRHAGSDTTLEIAWGPVETMRQAFEVEHRRQFGFHAGTTELVVGAVSVEAIEVEPAAQLTEGIELPARQRMSIARSVEVWHGGTTQPAALVTREELAPGGRFHGPALVIEHGSTTWVAPGWRARVGASGSLLLRRSHAIAHEPAAPGDRPDPMRLEVFNALFMHVAEQMGAVLQRTASSVNIKERLDFSCAIFDAEARLIANAPHMPVHLGSMGASVAAVLAACRDDLRPGDGFLVNSPYEGGTHLPDMTVVSPVFDESGQRLLFFTASRAHHADVGGVTPGSMPPMSHRIDEEGALVRPTRIVRDSVMDEARILRLLGEGAWPARKPAQNLADLRAQLAANSTGAAELRRAIGHHGERTVLAYMSHVQDNAEACMRRAIGHLHDGSFDYEMDNGQRIAVRVSVDQALRSVRVDFSGTSAQQPNNFNAPRAVTVAAVLYVFRTLIEEPIPLNAGCLRPIEIVVPRASMLDPEWPGAVVAGNVETSQCIVDALYGALGLQAASQGTMNNFTFGNERYQYYETIAGGAGAGPGYEGASGVQTHMTNSRLTDPEVLETRFPVLLRQFSRRYGSGGAGMHRGGDGLVRRIEFREEMTAAILANHRRIPPFGAAGGSPGAVGINRLCRADGSTEHLGATAEVRVRQGDAVEIETPGGGGWGDPAADQSGLRVGSTG